ncbi:hypothetical protein [Mucilaginibacter xinganensis]|uniref:Uncharacterized protein n=1 Tax=Mucilaginibacter xinganensis TaxID=1234841 RepID=A0A223NZN8_9SPHI|nr:hypothetical protein [Mucilaginibacter xinganensis]ASU35333.1 hypothetical protein MuYL_3448 [Mucilaginibacter xinganensis]
MAAKLPATVLQKENFKTRFSEIVKGNDNIKDKYTIQFFDTAVKSNYVINGLDGKSMNIIPHLSFDELESYRDLKNHWQSK